MKATTAAAVLLVLLTPVVSAAPSPSYFPLVPGATWTRKGDEGSQITARVVGEKAVGAVKCVTVETTVRRGAAARVTNVCYEATPTEVRIIETGSPSRTLVLDPPRTMLTLPPKVGRRWSWSSSYPLPDIKSTEEWVSKESVRVPAGTFTAWKLKTVTKRENISVTVFTWYAAGVGIVKTWREERRTGERRQGGTELVSYTIP